jgi:hypothetical protein
MSYIYVCVCIGCACGCILKGLCLHEYNRICVCMCCYISKLSSFILYKVHDRFMCVPSLLFIQTQDYTQVLEAEVNRLTKVVYSGKEKERFFCCWGEAK